MSAAMQDLCTKGKMIANAVLDLAIQAFTGRDVDSRLPVFGELLTSMTSQAIVLAMA